ncbi:MAG: glycosyltransferase family 2 protein [Sporolactobacillus sp.]|jgi:glycosyltransferase involved in cell wall biosynthesis|nr:glycosyltransferase family 2 protein [Sporolactobacillus sp.]
MENIAVLIPCYNEAQTIGKVVADFKTALPEALIYVYDNNSTDGTDDIARRSGAIVRYEQKQGKGQVIRRMFRDIDAECYLMVDGDNTYPAESARDMVRPILNHEADMVIGDRLASTYYSENKRPFHNIGNRLVRQLIKILFKTNVSDIMTGYRAFNYAFVKTFPILSKGFEIETEMTIHACDKNLGLKNVTVKYQDRESGSMSKLNTYSDGAKVLMTIFRLFKNYDPFKFFGAISLLLFLISFALALPVLVHYFQTGLVPRFPTLIVSGFLALASLLSLFGGMILAVLVQNERQNFEIKLNECLQLQKVLKCSMTDRVSEPNDRLLAKK